MWLASGTESVRTTFRAFAVPDEQAEKRHAFPNALLYLEKAERIDAVHSEVRAARPRLLAAAVLSHLKNKKPHLAAEKLVALAKLPQSQQGDRPAFLAALEYLVFKALSDEPRASEARLRTERLLGGGLAAGFLTYGLATIAKRGDFVFCPSRRRSVAGTEGYSGFSGESDGGGQRPWIHEIPASCFIFR